MIQKKLKMKDIDLLDVYKKKKEPSKATSLTKWIAFPAIMALALLSIFGVLTYQNYAMNNKIKDTNNEIKAIKNKIASDPNLEKASTLQELQTKASQYKTLYQNIQTYPQLSQNTFDLLLIAGDTAVDVTSFSYSRDAQTITLQIEANNANDAEQFVRRLKNTGGFAAVEYSGYSRVEKQQSKIAAIGGASVTPESSGSDEEDSKLQQLIEAVTNNSSNNTSETNGNQGSSTEHVYVYQASVLCTLK